MSPTPSGELALAHVRDLHAEASAGRLARLATCCRPSALRAGLVRAREAVTAFFRHGQLQVARPCCDWPA